MFNTVINTIYDISPGYWFEFFLEFLFGIITFVVAYHAIKIFLVTNQKQAKYFGLSFLFISFSYIIQSLFNFMILFELREQIENNLEFMRLVLFDRLGLSLHIFFMLSGLILLTWMTLKHDNMTSLVLIYLISFISLCYSINKLLLFFILSSLCLLFIAYYYVQNYARKRRKENFLIALAFVFLFIARIHFIFIRTNAFYFHLGHALELISYSFILGNFILLKNEQKKRSA